MKKPFLPALSLCAAAALFVSLSSTAFAQGIAGDSFADNTKYSAVSIESQPASSAPESSSTGSAASSDAGSSAPSSEASSAASSGSTSSSSGTTSSSSSSETESIPASSSSDPESISPESELAIESLFALEDEILIDSSYLTPGVGGRQELDLKLLKDQDITTGTLVLEGTSSNHTFVKIVDTSTDLTGNYNILIGEYGGVEIPAETGALNTFNTITNKQGISNMLPIYAGTSVDTISISNNGSPINLITSIAFPITYPSPSYSPTRTLGIVANGDGTHVNNFSVTDVSISNFNQGPSGVGNTYVYPALIGAQYGANIDNASIGNVSISWSQAQMGVAIGAAAATINHLEVTGNVTFTGTVLSGGLPSGTYSPSSLLGTSSGLINELIIRSTSVVTAKNISGGSYGVQIGFSGYLNGQASGRLITEPGSMINIDTFKAGSPGNIPIGGEGQYFEFGGSIRMSIYSSSTGTFIGKGYDSSIATDMLLIKSTADIQIFSKNYCSVAIGYYANTQPSAMNNLIVERGANIDLSIENTYSIRDYYTVDVAFGGTKYAVPKNIMIGATLNSQTGQYEVLPGNNGPETTIRLNNFRMLTYASGAPQNNTFYKAQLNANVYAEYKTSKSEFFGSQGYSILMGGNYLVKETEGDTLSYISFNEKRTGSYNSMQGYAYNQYFEPLNQMMYNDEAAENTFVYNIPYAGFDGTRPTYDYTSVKSFNSSVSATQKALYYPIRNLDMRMINPAPNGSIHINGALILEFDHPLSSADHMNLGKTLTIKQYSLRFDIPLDDANQEKFAFGSDLEGGNPNLLYIYLDKLTNSSGSHITPNLSITLEVPSLFSVPFDQEDPQLASVRSNNPYAVSLRVTEAIYNVDFDLNGAPGPGIPTQSLLKGTPATEPEAPVWEEHTFKGWLYENASSLTPWDFTEGIYENMTLIADWEVHTYNITYDGNGSNGGTVPEDTTPYAKGETVVISSETPTKTGFEFDGWQTSFDNNIHESGASFIMPGEDITLSAVWKALPPSSSSAPAPSSSSAPAPSSSSAPAPSSSSAPAPSSSSAPAPSSSSAPAPSSSSAPAPSSSSAPAPSSSSAPAPSSSSAPASSSNSAPAPVSSSVPASSNRTNPTSSGIPAPSQVTPSVTPENTDNTPAAQEAEREVVRERLIDSGVPTVTLGTTEVPLFGGNESFTWSLISLLLAVASAVTSAVLMVLWFIRRSEQENSKSQLLRILAAVLGVVSLVVFFLISNLSGVMILLDAKTILFAAIFVGQLLLSLLLKKADQTKVAGS